MSTLNCKKIEKEANKDKLFPKTAKIKKRGDYRKIFSKGKVIKNTYFTIIFTPNEFKTERIGIIIKKYLGKAHLRNKIKRMIRETYRLNKGLFPSEQDLIIIPKNNFKNLKYYQIKEEFYKLFNNNTSLFYKQSNKF